MDANAQGKPQNGDIALHHSGRDPALAFESNGSGRTFLALLTENVKRQQGVASLGMQSSVDSLPIEAGKFRALPKKAHPPGMRPPRASSNDSHGQDPRIYANWGTPDFRTSLSGNVDATRDSAEMSIEPTDVGEKGVDAPAEGVAGSPSPFASSSAVHPQPNSAPSVHRTTSGVNTSAPTHVAAPADQPAVGLKPQHAVAKTAQDNASMHGSIPLLYTTHSGPSAQAVRKAIYKPRVPSLARPMPLAGSATAGNALPIPHQIASQSPMQVPALTGSAASQQPIGNPSSSNFPRSQSLALTSQAETTFGQAPIHAPAGQHCTSSVPGIPSAATSVQQHAPASQQTASPNNHPAVSKPSPVHLQQQQQQQQHHAPASQQTAFPSHNLAASKPPPPVQNRMANMGMAMLPVPMKQMPKRKSKKRAREQAQRQEEAQRREEAQRNAPADQVPPPQEQIPGPSAHPVPSSVMPHPVQVHLVHPVPSSLAHAQPGSGQHPQNGRPLSAFAARVMNTSQCLGLHGSAAIDGSATRQSAVWALQHVLSQEHAMNGPSISHGPMHAAISFPHAQAPPVGGVQHATADAAARAAAGAAAGQGQPLPHPKQAISRKRKSQASTATTAQVAHAHEYVGASGTVHPIGSAGVMPLHPLGHAQMHAGTSGQVQAPGHLPPAQQWGGPTGRQNGHGIGHGSNPARTPVHSSPESSHHLAAGGPGQFAHGKAVGSPQHLLDKALARKAEQQASPGTDRPHGSLLQSRCTLHA